jgi:hypothetical protein
MDFDKFSIVITDDALEKELDKTMLKEMAISKAYNMKKWVLVLSSNDKLISTPKFMNEEEASIGMRSHNYIFKGVNDVYNEKLLCVIQMEKSKSGNMSTGEYFGFTINEDLKLFMLSSLLAVKISEIRKTSKCRQIFSKNKELILNLTTLSTEKFYPSLLVHIQKLMAPFFSFSKAFVLLYSKECTSIMQLTNCCYLMRM